MNENIKITDSGLICDNPSCDWIDETIKDEDLLDWVNKPCPKCGDNVLTEKDYINLLKLNKIVDYVNLLTEFDNVNKDLKRPSFITTPMDEIVDKLNDIHINNNGLFTMTINTHGELKITNIKKIDNGTI